MELNYNMASDWLMYAVLVDLSDAVEAVQLSLERISMEMVLGGLYHFYATN
jgi:hypothetical protein